MIKKSKRVIDAALATMAIILTGSLFAAGSASAAQGTKVTAAHSPAKTIMYVNCDPIVIIDRHPCLAVPAHAMAAVTVTARPAHAAASVTDLGTLPGDTNSVAQAVNDHDTVVGYSQAPAGGARAVTWDRQGSITGLPVPSGDAFSAATGINADGVIVGFAATLTTHRAVRWDRRGLVTDLGALPGGSFSQAVSVNAQGVAVGYAEASSGQPLAVRWSPDGTVTILGTLPGHPGYPDSMTFAINRHGTIVGAISDVTASGIRQAIAVRWGRGGSVASLPGLPGATATLATGITDEGVIVGFSGTPGVQAHAVEWHLSAPSQ